MRKTILSSSCTRPPGVPAAPLAPPPPSKQAVAAETAGVSAPGGKVFVITRYMSHSRRNTPQDEGPLSCPRNRVNALSGVRTPRRLGPRLWRRRRHRRPVSDGGSGAALCRHVGRQHLGQLVVLETALEELLLCQTTVVVFVHPRRKV